MTLFHTMLSDGRVVKYNTLEAPNPDAALMRANEEWTWNGGDKIIKTAVYEYWSGDAEYRYQWAPPGTYEDRPNLLEGKA